MLYFNTNVGATLSPVVRLGYDRRPPRYEGILEDFLAVLASVPALQKARGLEKSDSPTGGRVGVSLILRGYPQSPLPPSPGQKRRFMVELSC